VISWSSAMVMWHSFRGSVLEADAAGKEPAMDLFANIGAGSVGEMGEGEPTFIEIILNG
jgi:hypothetical protein